MTLLKINPIRPLFNRSAFELFIVIFILSLFTTYGFTKEELVEIMNKDGKTNSKIEGELAIFGRTGTFITKVMGIFHQKKMKKTLPPSKISSKLVDGKYLVVTSPTPENTYYSVITLGDKHNAYKMWSFSEKKDDVKLFNGVSLVTTKFISWTWVDKKNDIQSILSEHYNSNGERQASSIRLEKSILTLSTTSTTTVLETN